MPCDPNRRSFRSRWSVMRPTRRSIKSARKKRSSSSGPSARGRPIRPARATDCSGDLTLKRDQSRGQSSSSGRKGLGSDIPMSPRSGATLHRGAADKHADDTGTAMRAIAQILLTGQSVTLSKTHLTPQEVAKWIAHQRTQLEARTFDSRTLTTTISEHSWAMIELKIDSSRTLRENPRKDWREDWDMNTILIESGEPFSEKEGILWHSNTYRYFRYWFSTYSVRTYSWSTSHSPSGVCFLQFHLVMFHSQKATHYCVAL